MCDDCYHGDWSHVCGICGENESNDVPTYAVAVGGRANDIEAGEVLCRDCSVKAIVRKTRSGRWRVTTVRWWRHHWRAKTRVYRTRELATRMAKTYTSEDS